MEQIRRGDLVRETGRKDAVLMVVEYVQGNGSYRCWWSSIEGGSKILHIDDFSLLDKVERIEKSNIVEVVNLFDYLIGEINYLEKRVEELQKK